MFTKLILLASMAAFGWLIRRDNRLREGVSPALWIPTLWVGIIASRPISMWLGFGGGNDTTEGSPMDALFFIIMIFASLVVLSRRQVAWSRLISENWSIFLFYGFLLVSVGWANSPLVSFKRWFKEFGNILVLLVILTEANPQQALRAVFFRCGCVLMPLSVVFIRWFPDLGRMYNIHSGEMEAIGVACQKNSLGAMILVTSLIILWDVLELRKLRQQNPGEKLRFDLNLRIILLLNGAYLLNMCDSKTSMTCLGLGAAVLVATRWPFLHKHLVSFAIVGGLGYFALNQMFDVKGAVLEDLGRNASLTGRTDVWKVLLNVGTDPIIGTGFLSFWDDPHFQSKLPYWVAFSAHNGYIEIYLCGGAIGLCFLAVMILGCASRISRALAWDGDFGVVRFAVLLVAILANYTESNFAEMTPIGFLFLTAAIGHAEAASVLRQVDEPITVSKESGEGDVHAAGPADSVHN